MNAKKRKAKKIDNQPEVIEDEVEIQAKSLSEAVKELSSRAKNKDEKIEIKAIQEEQKGLFDMEGNKPAKIKLAIKRKPQKT